MADHAASVTERRHADIEPVQHITGRLIAPVCHCGNGTPRGHGAEVMPRPFRCDEVLVIRGRVGR